jgi:hypothetical protein
MIFSLPFLPDLFGAYSALVFSSSVSLSRTASAILSGILQPGCPMPAVIKKGRHLCAPLRTVPDISFHSCKLQLMPDDGEALFSAYGKQTSYTWCPPSHTYS